ncbi:hypothetical protein NHX12_001043 [Muraenolepis orangiensis]|uniref:DUF4604 domain-containing protein n=1 Tax=Muraenolepis orangiensis TaxID=630683 RepID=A0A9Q0IGU8_9TELE|nr:hypothetical protein NHX12_001043 [Muraenolepis orangiensis]
MNKNIKKSDISWVKPTEPSFLKKFKSDVGYKEGPNVDTKRQTMPTLDDDSGSDREDELPQIVVLKKGDLSSDEVKHIKGDGTSEKEDEPPADGKIVFKKPAKRSSADKFQGITASSSKKKKKSDTGDKEEKKEEKKKKKEEDDDEDEEEEEERRRRRRRRRRKRKRRKRGKRKRRRRTSLGRK